MKIETAISRLKRDWVQLIKELKKDIADECRATEDPEDNIPGMCLTIGLTLLRKEDKPEDVEHISWGWQSGDNSYTGGAYGHHDWAVVYLYRKSNSRDVAREIETQLLELIFQ